MVALRFNWSSPFHLIPFRFSRPSSVSSCVPSFYLIPLRSIWSLSVASISPFLQVFPFLLVPLHSTWSPSVPSCVPTCHLVPLRSIKSSVLSGPFPFHLVDLRSVKPPSPRSILCPSVPSGPSPFRQASPFLLVPLRSIWLPSVPYCVPPFHLVPLRSVKSFSVPSGPSGPPPF